MKIIIENEIVIGNQEESHNTDGLIEIFEEDKETGCVDFHITDKETKNKVEFWIRKEELLQIAKTFN